MRVGGERHATAALHPGEKTRNPLYGRMGLGPEPVWTIVKNLPPPTPGFDPQTI
jgi:hypothetical protein